MKTIILILTFCVCVCGQIAKKDIVVLKFQEDAATFEKYKVWSGKMQYVLKVQRSDGDAVSINGDAHWQDKAFPEMVEYVVQEIKSPKGKLGEVFLVSKNTSADKSAWMKQIKILVDPNMNIQQGLGAVIFKGTIADFLVSDYMNALEKSFFPKMFKESLASIPVDQQRKLNRWANLNVSAFSEVTFKEKKYFGAAISDGVVYNTLQLNQAERTSRQTEKSLKNLREIFAITGKIGNFDGIKLVTTISSYNFVNKGDRHDEKFEMYITFELLKKFIDADITNQELIDGSTILLDGSRMKVNMTSFS